jgi:hypothetical protein
MKTEERISKMRKVLESINWIEKRELEKVKFFTKDLKVITLTQQEEAFLNGVCIAQDEVVHYEEMTLEHLIVVINNEIKKALNSKEADFSTQIDNLVSITRILSRFEQTVHIIGKIGLVEFVSVNLEKEII